MGQMRRRMEEELRLRGYSERTVEAYLGAVRKLAAFHRRPPEEMGSEEVRAYLVHLTEEKRSFSTVNQHLCGIRFFYLNVLGRPCVVAPLVYQKKKKKLPVVLSEREVRKLLEAAADLKEKAIVMTLYSAGLRLHELTALRPQDIDSARMRIRIREGKGSKERHVLLSPTLLAVLREYFRQYRPGRWLFYGSERELPIPARSVQKMIEHQARRAGLQRRVSPHVLRHSFATHLLDHGTSVRHIQELLGHRSLKTTLIYTHVTQRSLDRVVSPLDRLGLEEPAP